MFLTGTINGLKNRFIANIFVCDFKKKSDEF